MSSSNSREISRRKNFRQIHLWQDNQPTPLSFSLSPRGLPHQHPECNKQAIRNWQPLSLSQHPATLLFQIPHAKILNPKRPHTQRKTVTPPPPPLPLRPRLSPLSTFSPPPTQHFLLQTGPTKWIARGSKPFFRAPLPKLQRRSIDFTSLKLQLQCTCGSFSPQASGSVYTV